MCICGYHTNYIGNNGKCFCLNFFALSCERRDHRAGFQLKILKNNICVSAQRMCCHAMEGSGKTSELARVCMTVARVRSAHDSP